MAENTLVTVKIQSERPITIPGRVVYIEPLMGFAVKFVDVPPETFKELEKLLAKI